MIYWLKDEYQAVFKRMKNLEADGHKMEAQFLRSYLELMYIVINTMSNGETAVMEQLLEEGFSMINISDELAAMCTLGVIFEMSYNDTYLHPREYHFKFRRWYDHKYHYWECFVRYSDMWGDADKDILLKSVFDTAIKELSVESIKQKQIEEAKKVLEGMKND